ncbi:nuclease-related domain-containing protein [Pseudarthrobacter sp. H2]|uniref:nuclease-related domain-containing protein n=1 Tax=Pseudarthrobacter sp. H2 TaxID=3418415 RepID=UPI003CF523DB
MTSDFASQGFGSGRDDIPQRVGVNERGAGHAVIEKLLADREGLPPRSLLGRVFGADPLTSENYPWYKGALGEIAVGRILERLGPGWMVLHAVPVGTGASDVDHVLIGPAGVFTLNTKNHSGQSVWIAGRTLMVSGKKQRHLYNASHEAARAAKLLTRGANATVEVTGVVVVVAPKSMTVRERPSEVVVVSDRQLLRWLSDRPNLLTPRQIAVITAAAMRPGTWHRNPPAVVDPGFLQYEFARLPALVDSARRRRAGWLLALLVGTPLVLATLSSYF